MHWRAVAWLCLAPVSSAWAQDIPPVLSCGGPISKSATHASLVKMFGAANVSIGEINLGEGQTETGTLLFASDPTRRLDVRWQDRKKRSRPHSITVRGSGEGAATAATHQWRIAVPGAAPPLGLGHTLQQVEAMNGRSFDLAGFEWDYSGTATDWRGGALGKLPGGCSLLVRFDPARDLSEKQSNAVAGDGSFKSNDPKMRAARPVIYEMGLYWD